MDDLNKIIINARVLSWKREFGPFVKCPECFDLLAKCDLCKGKGEAYPRGYRRMEQPYRQNEAGAESWLT